MYTEIDRPLLISSNTKRDSDLRYLVGTHVPDDIVVVFDGKKLTALVSALEINRLRKESKINEFFEWNELKASIKKEKITKFDILQRFLEKISLKKFSVNRNFPLFLGDKLRACGYEISIAESSILPQRLIKSVPEANEIKKVAAIVKLTFAEIEKILGSASVDSAKQLTFEGELLTSERLRSIIENFSYQLGAISEDTIVACGTDACDPHNIGHGPLKAEELIVIDFFPRSRESGYYADVSRTFIKGTPNNKQIKLYNAVKTAHDMAITMVQDGISAQKIMDEVLSVFNKLGYQSNKTANPPHGMIHALGHGLGLDIHEPPRVGLSEDILRAGMVITIEPGLYYQEIGGVRIEDDILIKDKSSELLTDIPYNWMIA